MRDHHIIKGSLNDATDDLAAFHMLALQWWPAQGYPIIEGGVVPKNAQTGDLDFNAPRTTAWDILKSAPDGDYWWWSPSDDPRFVDWKEYLAQNGYVLKCVETLKDWNDEIPEHERP